MTGQPPAERLLLALESTCDETAAAVVSRDGRILSSVIATQDDLHAEFSGVVPEIAARAHLENFLPVLRAALERSGVQPSQLEAVAVATQPGLVGSLLVGLATAKALALAWDKPLVAIDHLHAHIYACTLERQSPVFPAVAMVVSGGHTHLFDCRGPIDWTTLGCTIDDAAGEAFDKVAAMLDLPFPGGPALARLAAGGDPAAYKFPRPLLADRQRFDFSFSGLKTAVRYQLQREPDADRADIAASFQAAVVDCLIGKCELALAVTGRDRLAVGGGVAANMAFREALEHLAVRLGIEVLIAPKVYCTDNAAMGAIAWEHLDAGDTASLACEVTGGLVR